MAAVAPSATPHAAGRAVVPRMQGYLDRDGVRIFYELSGDAPETILILPPWAINHSRFWKGQVPYLSRHFRVLTFDPRGNGRSDRPESPEEYSAEATVGDAFALLDELGLDRVLLVAHCGSADKALLLTAHHPERFVGAVFMSPALPITPPLPERVMSFTDPLPTDEGWAKQNRHYWHATTAASSSSSSDAASRSRTPRSSSRTASVGRSRRHRRPSSLRSSRMGSTRRRCTS
ncbi:MAG: alpha/beta fold hydrolase [Gaiellaceae bacterium]